MGVWFALKIIKSLLTKGIASGLHPTPNPNTACSANIPDSGLIDFYALGFLSDILGFGAPGNCSPFPFVDAPE